MQSSASHSLALRTSCGHFSAFEASSWLDTVCALWAHLCEFQSKKVGWKKFQTAQERPARSGSTLLDITLLDINVEYVCGHLAGCSSEGPLMGTLWTGLIWTIWTFWTSPQEGHSFANLAHTHRLKLGRSLSALSCAFAQPATKCNSRRPPTKWAEGAASGGPLQIVIKYLSPQVVGISRVTGRSFACLRGGQIKQLERLAIGGT